MNYLVLDWLSKVIFRWRRLMPIHEIQKSPLIKLINNKK